jgi:hypothetical protein
MAKRYTIHTADFFTAVGKGELSIDVPILYAGTLWMDILLTDEQKSKYTFSIT